jgi:energy-coupling factor transporter ATP-binding protein EcfA2
MSSPPRLSLPRFSLPTLTPSKSKPPTWEPGQHLSLIGQTGTGKSTLAASLLESRKYKVVLKSKPDKVTYPTDRTIRTAAGMDNTRYDSFLLVPKYEDQQRQFSIALERVWRQGGWTIYGDELFYLSERLRLTKPIERLLTQGRSKGISVAIGMQRPARVTRFAISESTHVLSFGLEGRDAKELSYATTRAVEDAVSGLPEHHFVWFKRPRTVWVGTLDIASGELHGEYIR